MCLVSPCDRNAVDSRSACGVRVGIPVEGPMRCTSKMTPGNLGVVAQPGELRHKRNARTRSRCHRARTRPSCAQHHADGGQLVFGLHDRESGLAFRRNAELLQQIGGGFNQRRRRRNGIPRHHRHPGEHRAHAAGRVAVDDDFARGLVHVLDEVGVLLHAAFPVHNRSPP